MTPGERAELKAAVDARRRVLTFRHDSRGRMVPVREHWPARRPNGADLTRNAEPERGAVSELLALVSGGGDSTAAALAVERDPQFAGVAYIDTGTALPGVREHVEALARRRGWPLIVLESCDAFDQLVARFGLPGPGFHALPYRLLKERRLRDLYRERGRVRLATGVRRSESVRRMGTTSKRRAAPFLFESPIIDATVADVDAALALAGESRSDVSLLAGRSGECNCGAFAGRFEREMLCSLWPSWSRDLERWERIARRHGRWSVWGRRPPPPVAENQERLFLCEACTPLTLELPTRERDALAV